MNFTIKDGNLTDYTTIYKKSSLSSGFTLVELLIVIIVIAILAAITVVAYNGIQDLARQSAAQSATSQASKKLQSYFLTNAETYPPDLATAGITNSGNTTYQYSYNNSVNPKTYCITTTVNTISYYQNNSTQPSPAPGGCPGHGVGGVAAITNLVTNPSLESNGTGWGGANAATGIRSTLSAIFGSQGMHYTAPANNLDSGATIPVASTVIAQTSYTASVSIRAITAGSYALSVQGLGGTNSRESRTLAANQVVRLSLTWTPTDSGSIAFYALRNGNQVGVHEFDVDGAMLLQGSTSSNYADGSSPNWVWNGTPNNSTSTGPPL